MRTIRRHSQYNPRAAANASITPSQSSTPPALATTHRSTGGQAEEQTSKQGPGQPGSGRGVAQ